MNIATKSGIDSIGTGMSVLGERPIRLQTGQNKIRSGIMVLTAARKQHPKSQAIYDAGVAAGKRWKEIEKELIEACKFEKSPMTPKNVAYFTARRHDFISPECADEIMRLYGEDRGEGRKLYRFPVIFPLDAWAAVMPHGLHCYTRNELVYWSEYGPDGKRYCYTRAPVTVDPKSKRAVRVFGGRQVILRPDNDGLCVPEKCPEYQARKCNLDGSFLFYMPGITGMSVVELTTKSFYSLDAARKKLEMVAHLRGGKISGTVDGRPLFYFSKKLDEVSMLDEQGKPKKVKQWLIVLEADVDMSKMFMANERPALEASAAQAVAALEAPAENTSDIDADEGEPDETPQAPAPAETPTAPTVPPEDELTAKIKLARKYLAEGLNILGVTLEQFAKYGVAKWGAGWSHTMEGLDKAKAALQEAADNPSALADIKNWTGV